MQIRWTGKLTETSKDLLQREEPNHQIWAKLDNQFLRCGCWKLLRILLFLPIRWWSNKGKLAKFAIEYWYLPILYQYYINLRTCLTEFWYETLPMCSYSWKLTHHANLHMHKISFSYNSPWDQKWTHCADFDGYVKKV